MRASIRPLRWTAPGGPAADRGTRSAGSRLRCCRDSRTGRCTGRAHPRTPGWSRGAWARTPRRSRRRGPQPRASVAGRRATPRSRARWARSLLWRGTRGRGTRPSARGAAPRGSTRRARAGAPRGWSRGSRRAWRTRAARSRRMPPPRRAAPRSSAG